MKRLPTFLEAGELAAVLAVSPPRHRLYFLLCARAGLRVSEAVKVRHEDVIWRDGEPVVLHLIGKGDKEALLPLAPSLRRALMDASGPDRRGWLFPGTKTHIVDRQARYWLVVACEKVGILRAKAHPHALRHSFANHLLRGGVNLREIQDLMRHSSLTVTTVYLHTNPERLQSAVDSVEEVEVPTPPDDPNPPVLRRAAAVVLETITAEPGLTGAELAQRLGRREQRINVDVQSLIALGLVIPDGRPRRLYPAHDVALHGNGNGNGHHANGEELMLLEELERITRRKLELLQARPGLDDSL